MATKPVIMSIDDDPEVLAAIERDLRLRYRKDYRVMKASSGREALETVKASRSAAPRSPCSSPMSACRR